MTCVTTSIYFKNAFFYLSVCPSVRQSVCRPVSPISLSVSASFITFVHLSFSLPLLVSQIVARYRLHFFTSLSFSLTFIFYKSIPSLSLALSFYFLSLSIVFLISSLLFFFAFISFSQSNSSLFFLFFFLCHSLTLSGAISITFLLRLHNLDFVTQKRSRVYSHPLARAIK